MIARKLVILDQWRDCIRNWGLNLGTAYKSELGNKEVASEADMSTNLDYVTNCDFEI